MELRLNVGQYSEQGPRSENQDAMRLVTPGSALALSKGHLIGLADGVSQCADGGLAARSTLQALAMDYYATPQTWPVAQALDRLLIAQNQWLRANGRGQPLLTTLSTLVLRGRRFTLAHVGDCRVYRYHRGALARLSIDHTWEQPGMQHVLKRALGLDQHLMVDYQEGDLQEGEVFVLLSDGVWSMLHDTAISATLREQSDPQVAAHTLVRAALLAGGQDNASAVVVRIDALGPISLGDSLLQLDGRPLPPPLKPGQAFEGWRVECLLARSQASVVYRVLDPQDQPWLLKTLTARQGDSPDAQQHLLLEEWFMRRVAGRYFPELHPLPKRQHHYYVMRHYPGRTLAQWFDEVGPLPMAQWQDIAGRLLRAVGMLHRRNILHRDIKPENLLWGDDGELRVLDFGLAYCPGLSAQGTGTVPGTPSFIAPEAYTGAVTDARQDLYAVGITLYFLLTGHYPYGEIEAFQRPRFGEAIDPGRYRPDLAPWLQTILLRSVAAKPEQRFETAEQWLLAMDQGEVADVVRRQQPLLEREPLKVWQAVAAVSLVVNLVLLWWVLH